MRAISSLLFVAGVAGFQPVFTTPPASQQQHAAPAVRRGSSAVALAGPSAASEQQRRRDVLAGAAALLLVGAPGAAMASGGATAGKYTTIPIAKRRYFGRVKQGVYEYLLVGDAIKKGNMQAQGIDDFFADTIKVSEAKLKRQCFGDEESCKTKEKFSSRWEDMKLSMFLLGNAFRMDSGKPPEKVKQVKEAKAFIGQVEKLRKARLAGDKKTVALTYAASIEALEAYLNDVELPPTFAPDYLEAADLEVLSLCQGSFCI